MEFRRHPDVYARTGKELNSDMVISFVLTDIFLFFSLWQIGLVNFLLEYDKTYLSFFIMAVYFLSNILLYEMEKTFSNEKFKVLKDWEMYIEQLLPSLGMIGTIIGFMLLFVDILEPGTSITPEYIKNVMFLKLTHGLGTATLTTIVGLVTSLFLSAKMHILRYV